MLNTEPSGSGLQATLRAQGLLRYFQAAFLCVWLCGWAVGEWFALRMLALLVEAVTGHAYLAAWFPPLGGQPPSEAVLPFFFVFIAFWISMWTFAGLNSVQQLLALFFGRDVVRWGRDGLEHWLPWLASRTRLEAQDITGFRIHRGNIVADGRKRATRITGMGSEEERRQLASLLDAWRASTGVPVPLPADESPLPEFVAVHDETGAVALMRPRGTRRTTGVLMGVVGLALLGGLVSLFSQKSGVSLVLGVTFLGLLGAVCLYVSLWLLAVRETWHIGQNRLERRREMFGRVSSTEFTPLALELQSRVDSDGDTRWDLVVSGGGRRQVLTGSIDDPNPPLTLGEWLAERTGAHLDRHEPENTLRRAS
jgi:hypothetical protein